MECSRPFLVTNLTIRDSIRDPSKINSDRFAACSVSRGPNHAWCEVRFTKFRSWSLRECSLSTCASSYFFRFRLSTTNQNTKNDFGDANSHSQILKEVIGPIFVIPVSEKDTAGKRFVKR